MPEARLNTPFGSVLLAAENGAVSPWTAVAPDLPAGQRIDACHVAGVTRAAGDPAELSIALDWTLADGFGTGLATGERLDASSIEGGDLIAAVGCRDGEWIADQPGAHFISFSGTATSSLYVINIDRDAAFSFRAAASWTLNPKTEAEEDAPWFAVDLALPF